MIGGGGEGEVHDFTSGTGNWSVLAQIDVIGPKFSIMVIKVLSEYLNISDSGTKV